MASPRVNAFTAADIAAAAGTVFAASPLVGVGTSSFPMDDVLVDGTVSTRDATLVGALLAFVVVASGIRDGTPGIDDDDDETGRCGTECGNGELVCA